MRKILKLLSLLWIVGCSNNIPEGTEKEHVAPADPYTELSNNCTSGSESQFLSLLNEVRLAQGTPKTTCLFSLSQTAYNHSYYLSQNTDVGISHEEEPGRRGFTGVTLGDRAEYTGIDRAAFWLNEGIGGGEKPDEILSEHLRSVYHRSHLLSPGTKYVGLANDAAVLQSVRVDDFTPIQTF